MTNPTLWPAAPQKPQLSSEEVHVWRSHLDFSETSTRVFNASLSLEERQRADRFRFMEARRHYVAAHALLRFILADYLQKPPSGLEFSHGVNGKPFLEEDSDLRFNMSHSHGLGLFAVAFRRETGVDLEWINAAIPMMTLAERFFSPNETSLLRALPASLQAQGFFNCWTRKESYIKAIGEGLSMPLNDFEVSLDPSQPAAILKSTTAGLWSIKELNVGTDYAAAVVAEGSGWKLKCWQYSKEIRECFAIP